MKWPLTAFAGVLLLAGTWGHDWSLIIASAAIGAIWPLISGDVRAAALNDPGSDD